MLRRLLSRSDLGRLRVPTGCRPRLLIECEPCDAADKDEDNDEDDCKNSPPRRATPIHVVQIETYARVVCISIQIEIIASRAYSCYDFILCSFVVSLAVVCAMHHTAHTVAHSAQVTWSGDD